MLRKSSLRDNCLPAKIKTAQTLMDRAQVVSPRITPITKPVRGSVQVHNNLVHNNLVSNKREIVRPNKANRGSHKIARAQSPARMLSSPANARRGDSNRDNLKIRSNNQGNRVHRGRNRDRGSSQVNSQVNSDPGQANELLGNRVLVSRKAPVSSLRKMRTKNLGPKVRRDSVPCRRDNSAAQVPGSAQGRVRPPDRDSRKRELNRNQASQASQARIHNRGNPEANNLVLNSVASAVGHEELPVRGIPVAAVSLMATLNQRRLRFLARTS
jgi:hypothetical protein